MLAAWQGRVTMGPRSWRVPAAHGILRPRSTPAALHSWHSHNPGCGSGLARGMLPLDHPFPAKLIPPSARRAPGTAALPGNSCRRRARGIAAASAGRAGLGSSDEPRYCRRWVAAPRAGGAAEDGSVIGAPHPGIQPGGSEWATSCHPRRHGETRRCRVTDPAGIFMAGLKIPPLVGFFPPIFFRPCTFKRLEGGVGEAGAVGKTPL